MNTPNWASEGELSCLLLAGSSRSACPNKEPTTSVSFCIPFLLPPSLISHLLTPTSWLDQTHPYLLCLPNTKPQHFLCPVSMGLSLDLPGQTPPCSFLTHPLPGHHSPTFSPAWAYLWLIALCLANISMLTISVWFSVRGVMKLPCLSPSG